VIHAKCQKKCNHALDRIRKSKHDLGTVIDRCNHTDKQCIENVQMWNFFSFFLVLSTRSRPHKGRTVGAFIFTQVSRRESGSDTAKIALGWHIHGIKENPSQQKLSYERLFGCMIP
jgi:hypothetical protein